MLYMFTFSFIVITLLFVFGYYILAKEDIEYNIKFFCAITVLLGSIVILLSVLYFAYSINKSEKDINKVKIDIDDYYAIIESEECNWINTTDGAGYYEYKYIIKRGNKEYYLFTKNRDILGNYNIMKDGEENERERYQLNGMRR